MKIFLSALFQWVVSVICFCLPSIFKLCMLNNEGQSCPLHMGVHFFQQHLLRWVLLSIPRPWSPPWSQLTITGLSFQALSSVHSPICPSWRPAPYFTFAPSWYFVESTGLMGSALFFLLKLIWLFYELVLWVDINFFLCEKCHRDAGRDCVTPVSSLGNWMLLKCWFLHSTTMRGLCFIYLFPWCQYC